jgi:hypothetical protein
MKKVVLPCNCVVGGFCGNDAQACDVRVVGDEDA